jgi:hypothetical protein
MKKVRFQHCSQVIVPIHSLCLACTQPLLVWVRALLPDATEVWVIEPKTGVKLASSNASIHADSLAAFCRGEKCFSLPAGGHGTASKT